MHFLWRSSCIFGASKAYVGDQPECPDYPRAAHLIEDVDEGQSIVALQRHRGIDTLLGCQHLGEGVWEFPGSYVNGRELREEDIPGCWHTPVSARVVFVGSPWTHSDWTTSFGGRAS